MGHGPPAEWKKQKSENYKSKLGIYMFIAYTILYFAFIAIAIIDARLLGMDIGSLNLAIVYGFGLIVVAIILALIYNYLCSKKEKLDDPEENVGGEAKQ